MAKVFLLILVLFGFAGCANLQEKIERSTDKYGMTRAERAAKREKDKASGVDPDSEHEAKAPDTRLVPNRLEYIEPTSVTAAEAYKSIKIWAAKEYRGSPIKFDDEKSFKVVIKGTATCAHRRDDGELIIQGEFPMDFEFQAKDKRVRLVFANPIDELDKAKPVRADILAKAETRCIDRIRKDIIAAMAPAKEW